jgi:hypothetical protein
MAPCPQWRANTQIKYILFPDKKNDRKLRNSAIMFLACHCNLDLKSSGRNISPRRWMGWNLLARLQNGGIHGLKNKKADEKITLSADSSGFGSGSVSLSFLQWLSRCQQKVSFYSKLTYCRNIYMNYIITGIQRKQVKNCGKQCFSQFFACWWKDQESDPDPYK